MTPESYMIIRDGLLVIFAGVALYIMIAANPYYMNIVGMSKADATDVAHADDISTGLVPEGSMIVVGGARSSEIVVGMHDSGGSVIGSPTVLTR